MTDCCYFFIASINGAATLNVAQYHHYPTHHENQVDVHEELFILFKFAVILSTANITFKVM
jgi:hypothetical protein